MLHLVVILLVVEADFLFISNKQLWLQNSLYGPLPSIWPITRSFGFMISLEENVTRFKNINIFPWLKSNHKLHKKMLFCLWTHCGGVPFKQFKSHDKMNRGEHLLKFEIKQMLSVLIDNNSQTKCTQQYFVFHITNFYFRKPLSFVAFLCFPTYFFDSTIVSFFK